MKPGISNLKFFILFFTVAGFILASCESNRWFQSEDSLSAKIQTTCNKIKINPASASEQWTFSEGKVSRMKITTDTTITDNGNYSIHTSLSKAYLTISDFTVLPADNLNGKWEILELDGGILSIATDHDGTSGVQELEFQEK